jgi:hypothetical protein
MEMGEVGIGNKNGWRQHGFLRGGEGGGVTLINSTYPLLPSSGGIRYSLPPLCCCPPHFMYKRYSALKTKENFLVDKQH